MVKPASIFTVHDTFFALLLSFSVWIAMIGSTMSARLDIYRWEARPVLAFAPELGDRKLSRQIALFKTVTAGIEDREMAVLLVTGRSGEPYVRFGPPELKFSPPDRGASIETLRKTYGISPDAFTVILVGKDGGEKNRWTDIVDPQTIFDQIDSMPMRRNEMREKG